MSFDTTRDKARAVCLGLNPFRAGRCLSPHHRARRGRILDVSIPFDQGNVFRRRKLAERGVYGYCLNPFRSGQCLST